MNESEKTSQIENHNIKSVIVGKSSLMQNSTAKASSIIADQIKHKKEDFESVESILAKNQTEAQIVLLEDIDNVVNEIANKTNESKIEVLRKAMSLMKIIVEAKEYGYKFGLTKNSKLLDSEISL